MEYVVKFKKSGFFYKKITVVGHSLNQNIDRMDFYFKDGSIYSVGNWAKYDLKLGLDWVVAIKKKMDEEAGQEVKVK